MPKGKPGFNKKTLPCEVEGCEKLQEAKNLCKKHLYRFNKYGTTELSAKPTQCSVKGCENKRRKREFCEKHYIRLRSYGTVDDPPRIVNQKAKKEAEKQGRKTFFGTPCSKKGHGNERFVECHTCIQCREEYLEEYKSQGCSVEGCNNYLAKKGLCATHAWRYEKHGIVEDPPKVRNAKINQKAREEAELRGDTYYFANVLCARGHNSKRLVSDASCIECGKEDRQDPQNKMRANFLARKYLYQKMNATPSWADQEAIRFFYECCPAECEVDHVIPLQGKLVCGLHVETNLQWLPVSLNRQKSNLFEIED